MTLISSGGNLHKCKNDIPFTKWYGKKRKWTVTIMGRLRMSGTEAVLPHLPSFVWTGSTGPFYRDSSVVLR
jgi:hypothetical protein